MKIYDWYRKFSLHSWTHSFHTSYLSYLTYFQFNMGIFVVHIFYKKSWTVLRGFNIYRLCKVSFYSKQFWRIETIDKLPLSGTWRIKIFSRVLENLRAPPERIDWHLKLLSVVGHGRGINIEAGRRHRPYPICSDPLPVRSPRCMCNSSGVSNAGRWALLVNCFVRFMSFSRVQFIYLFGYLQARSFTISLSQNVRSILQPKTSNSIFPLEIMALTFLP